ETAEQLPDRDARRLAREVPAGQLDAAQGHRLRLAGDLVGAGEHLLDEPLDARRIFTDEEGREGMLEVRRDQGRLHRAALADAGEALVGVDADQDRTAQDDRLDTGNLHGRASWTAVE